MITILRTAVLLSGLGLSGLGYSGQVFAPAELTVSGLRCEHRLDPVGVGEAKPCFEWRLQEWRGRPGLASRRHPAGGREQGQDALATRRGVTQSAYQIRVASSRELVLSGEADLWDSGRVRSDQSYSIVYGGKPLESSRRYYWTVRVWDQTGRPTNWSEPGTFVTGLLFPGDWQAKWITANRTEKDPLPIFRKAARLEKPIKDAIVHICGLGHYELRINGRRVGDYQMDPGWTNYRKTCLYSSYDVTDMLEPGDNVIAVMLGNGMYNVPGGRYTKFKGTFGPPKLICQMNLTFADGSTRVIASDQTWKCTLGPIVFTCIYGGEDYDARREQAGWDRPGFDDRAWDAAKVCEGPGGKLVAQYAPRRSRWPTTCRLRPSGASRKVNTRSTVESTCRPGRS